MGLFLFFIVPALHGNDDDDDDVTVVIVTPLPA